MTKYIPIEERLPELKKKYKNIFWEVNANITNAGTYKYDSKRDLWLMYTRRNDKLNYWYTIQFISKFMRDGTFWYRKVLFANYAHTEKRYYNGLLKKILKESADKTYIVFTKNRV